MTNQAFNLPMGKVPPSDLELECALLGQYIQEPEQLYCNPVDKEIFYNHDNCKIFEQLQEMTKKGDKIDLLTVTMRCSKIGISPLYITQLVGKVILTLNIEAHIRILKELQIRRSTILKSYQIQEAAYSGEFDNLIEGISDLSTSMIDSSGDDTVEVNKVCDGLRDIIAANAHRDDDEVSGFSTGFNSIDKFTQGFQRGDLLVLGGESSQGKTSFAVNCLRYQVKTGVKAAIFTLEMTNEQLLSRMVAQDVSISAKTISMKTMDEEHIYTVNQAIDQYRETDLYFIDKVNIPIEKVIAEIRVLHLKKGVEVVYVDFLQRMRLPKGSNKADGYALISQRLKDTAKELNISIVLLSQLNKDKDNPEPTMGRLRGSGEVAEAADIVGFIWRPEFYKIETIDLGDGEESTAGLGIFKIEKGRNIGIAQIPLKWTPHLTLFEDYSSDDTQISHNEFDNIDYTQANRDSDPF